MRNSLGIHYDYLDSYKELLDLGEAKAQRVNELVILTIHLTKVTEDVIMVLAIDILPPFSKRRHSHVEEIRTCVLRKMANGNSVDFPIEFNSRLKRDYGSKTRKRKNSDTNNHSFMLQALSHLLQCSAVKLFVFYQTDLLFRVEG